MRCALFLLLALCSQGETHREIDMTGPSNTTSAFLGERSLWVDARVELKDVQGLFGGRNVLVTGQGAIFVQVVEVGEKGMSERRYARAAGTAPDGQASPDAVRLLECAILNDFATIRSAGSRNDRTRFDSLYKELRKVEEMMIEGASPVHEGPYRSVAWAEWVGIARVRARERAAITTGGMIKISGGCEAYSEGTLSWELRRASVKLSLRSSEASEFFLNPDGTPIGQFEIVVPRKTMAAFVSELRSKTDTAGPNDHPSTRGARLEMEIPLEPGGVLREELDELRGDRDIGPALETVTAFARSCASLSETAGDLFLEDYREPVLEAMTPPAASWIPGLTLLCVYEEAMMQWPPRPEREYGGDTWIVTQTGRRFSTRDVAAALEEIHYEPAREAEAAQAAAMCVELLCRPHVFRLLDGSAGSEEALKDRVPEDVRRRTSAPAVTVSQGGCEVALSGYVQAMSGFPQEWVKRWRGRFVRGAYGIEEERMLWTERGRYKW